MAGKVRARSPVFTPILRFLLWVLPISVIRHFVGETIQLHSTTIYICSSSFMLTPRQVLKMKRFIVSIDGICATTGPLSTDYNLRPIVMQRGQHRTGTTCNVISSEALAQALDEDNKQLRTLIGTAQFKLRYISLRDRVRGQRLNSQFLRLISCGTI